VGIVAFDFARIAIDQDSERWQSAYAGTAAALSLGDSRPQLPPAPLVVTRGFPSNADLSVDVSTGSAGADFHTARTLETAPDEFAETSDPHAGLWPAQLVVRQGLGSWRWLSALPQEMGDAFAAALRPTAVNEHAVETSGRDGALSSSEKTPPADQESLPASPSPTRLVIRNATESGKAVHFLVNERAFALLPGEKIELTGRRWLVRFHRGGEYGDAAYALWPGSYEFAVGKGGWDIARNNR
jgi:hypothetical protein